MHAEPHAEPHATQLRCINPLRPFERAQRLAVPHGATIAELQPTVPGLLLCRLNGGWVLRRNWAYALRAGDVLEWHELPQGGGNTSNSLLRLAIIVAAIVAQQYELIPAAAASAAIALSPYIANALVPLQQPPGLNGGASASPTYTVSLSGNQARLEQPIPVIYGRHLVMPDFAAQPYGIYDANNDQYYHALHCIGQGSYVVERVMIDDTDIDHFAGVQYAVLPPGTAPTLVAANLVTAPEVAGQDLLTGRYVGGFTVCASKLTTARIGIDIVFPRGLGLFDSSGNIGNKTATWRIETRKVSDFGVPLAGWTVLANETLTAASATPVRRSYLYTLASPARVEVRALRTDTKDTNQRALHDITWAGLRATLSAPAPLCATATYLEIKVRASEQLTGLSQRRVACIVRRKLRTWHPETLWSAEVETRSIAWALADKWTNAVYGDGLPDTRCDLYSLWELDALWATRQDRLDIVMDSRTDSLSADQMMAGAGRARVFRRNGVRTLTRDGRQSVPVTGFTSRDIRPGSLSIAYRLATSDSHDGVVVEYFDNRAWDWLEIDCPAPGYTTATWRNPIRIKLPGVTGAKHAEREGLYRAADMLYRRKLPSWSTEMMGLLPAYGSAVLLAPALPGWGLGADVAAFDGPALTLTLSEPPVWTTGADHFVSVLNDDGTYTEPLAVRPGPTANTLVLAENLGLSFVTDDARRARTRVLFGTAGQRIVVRVLGIKPAGRDADGSPLIAIDAVAEDDRVHQADAALLPGPAEVQDPVTPEDDLSGGGGGGGGSTILVQITDQAANAGLGIAYYGLYASGHADVYGLGYLSGEWSLGGTIEPAAAAAFEVRYTYLGTGGANVHAPTSGAALNTWLALSTDRNQYLDYAGTAGGAGVTWVCALRVEIRDTATSTVQCSATITLMVGAPYDNPNDGP